MNYAGIHLTTFGFQWFCWGFWGERTRIESKSRQLIAVLGNTNSEDRLWKPIAYLIITQAIELISAEQELDLNTHPLRMYLIK